MPRVHVIQTATCCTCPCTRCLERNLKLTINFKLLKYGMKRHIEWTSYSIFALNTWTTANRLQNHVVELTNPGRHSVQPQ